MPEGNYSYQYTKPDSCLVGIDNMHKIAGRLWRANKHDKVNSLNIQVIDARASEDFNAKNILASINLPYMELFKSDGILKSTEDLEQLFEQKGISKNKKTYCMCQTGLMACMIEMACRIVGI